MGGNTPFYAGGLLYTYDAQGGHVRVFDASTGNAVATLDCGTGHWNSVIVADNRIALPKAPSAASAELAAAAAAVVEALEPLRPRRPQRQPHRQRRRRVSSTSGACRKTDPFVLVLNPGT